MATNPRTKNTVEIDCPYDVGDIYMTKSERKPQDRWPGTTWYQIQGVFMLGAENEGKYKNDTSGGEEYHTLTINEMPSHSHSGYVEYGTNSNLNHPVPGQYNQINFTYHGEEYHRTFIEDTGGNFAHNNMPPYNTCYIYQRLT